MGGHVCACLWLTGHPRRISESPIILSLESRRPPQRVEADFRTAANEAQLSPLSPSSCVTTHPAGHSPVISTPPRRIWESFAEAFFSSYLHQTVQTLPSAQSHLCTRRLRNSGNAHHRHNLASNSSILSLTYLGTMAVEVVFISSYRLPKSALQKYLADLFPGETVIVEVSRPLQDDLPWWVADKRGVPT